MKPPSEAPSIPRASRAQGHSRPSSKPLLDCAANTPNGAWVITIKDGVGLNSLRRGMSDDGKGTHSRPRFQASKRPRNLSP
jgi:hypothetical protein